MATFYAVTYDTSFLTLVQSYIIKPYGVEQFSDYIRGAEVYKTYFGIGTPILNPAGSEIMIYEGKKNVDKWYPVRILDASDSTLPRTNVAVGSVTVTYGFESAVAETPYIIVGADWKEQGNGNYWLNIGASEFTNNGKYTVKVRTYPIANDIIFYVEVRDFMATETIADVPVANQGTAQSGTLSTIQLAITASAVNNFYSNSTVVIVNGLGAGQARVIKSYAGGTTTAIVDPDWNVAPNNTSVYKIVPLGSSPLDLIAIANAILGADLQLYLGAGVGFRNIGNILGQLAQSEFEQREYIFATVPIPAQNITLQMVNKGCIQYEIVTMSYTKNWAAPDKVFYLLHHYNLQQRVDMIKPSLGIVW